MSLRQEFYETGFVILRNAVPSARVTSVLNAIEKMNAVRPIYYSQSMHKVVRTPLDETGNISESVENPHRAANAAYVRNSVRDVLLSEPVVAGLREILGHDHLEVFQSMLFDKSTGTLEHSDQYYLDTKPTGGVVGTWFALEDYDDDCGKFYVRPKSHELDRLMRDSVANHNEARLKFEAAANQSGIEKYFPDMAPGDVLIWHGNLLHGADSPSASAGSTRKSITAHFLAQNAIRADYNKARANFIKTYDIGGSSIAMPSYLSDIAHVARWRLSQYAPRQLVKELSMKRADYNTR